MTKIDFWLLDDVFQRFSDWFQKLTGKNNFFLARCAVYLYLIVALFCSVNNVMKSVVAIMALVLSLLIFLPMISRIEAKCMQGHGDIRSINYLRSIPLASVVRLFFVCLVLAQLITTFIKHWTEVPNDWALLNNSVCLRNMLLVYFASCTPLPPGESKIKKWITSLKSSLSGTVLKPAMDGV